MGCNIDGLLRNTKGKKITFLEDDNGRQLSDKEARQFLDECKGKGWKLFGSSECEGFDPFGGGCPGHEIIEDEIEKTELPKNNLRRHLKCYYSNEKIN